MGVWEQQRAVQLYRGQIPSPGRPTVAWREDRVRFWAAVASGVMTEDAAAEAGVYAVHAHVAPVPRRVLPNVAPADLLKLAQIGKYLFCETVWLADDC